MFEAVQVTVLVPTIKPIPEVTTVPMATPPLAWAVTTQLTLGAGFPVLVVLKVIGVVQLTGSAKVEMGEGQAMVGATTNVAVALDTVPNEFETSTVYFPASVVCTGLIV